MIGLMLCLAGLVFYLIVRVEVLKADLVLERELCDEDVKFYSDAYFEAKKEQKCNH